MDGMGIIIFFILVASCLLIWLWYWIAKQFYQAAIDKGYDDQKYLWITFLLGFIGCALVIALPDRNGTQKVNLQQQKDDLPDL